MPQDASPGRVPVVPPATPTIAARAPVDPPATPTIAARVAALTLASVLTATTALATIPAHGQAPQAPPLPSGSGPVVAYRLPVDDLVLRLFDPPVQRWSRGHRGVDISAVVGTQVLAPAYGVVTVSRTVVDRDVLTIEHPDGLRSSLEPLADGVPEGTVVAAGAVVGTVDTGTHCGAADCLHWGVRRGTEYLDPLSLLPGASPVVLLARDVSSDRSPGASPAAGASRPCASARCETR